MAAEARERMTGTSWRRPLLPLAGALFMPMSEHNIQWEVGVDGQRGDALGCESVVCEAQLHRLLASLDTCHALPAGLAASCREPLGSRRGPDKTLTLQTLQGITVPSGGCRGW